MLFPLLKMDMHHFGVSSSSCIAAKNDWKRPFFWHFFPSWKKHCVWRGVNAYFFGRVLRKGLEKRWELGFSVKMVHYNFGCPPLLIIYLLQREDLRLCQQNYLVAFFTQIPKIPGCWPISSRAAFGGYFSDGFWFLPMLFLLKSSINCSFYGFR